MNYLMPCPFCGSKVRIISYWQDLDCKNIESILEIGCYRCGDFKLTHNTYYDGFKPKTAYDVWNSRANEIGLYDYDDADDWSED